MIAHAPQSDESLKGPLVYSLAFHVSLVTLLAISSVYSHRGEAWGGPGGAVSVGLVGSVPAIPMPAPDVVTTNRTVDNSKGLYTSEPQPKPEPKEDATPLPKFEKNKPPKYVSRPSRVLENNVPPPSNAIPYGRGGTPSVPYSSASFAMGNGGAMAGLGFQGAGGGDFGARFPWYVEAVQRRISSNWLQATVDPGLAWAPRVVATFTILRDGSVTSAQITRSSGNQSVDLSCIRAIRESSPMNRLPPEYSGSDVNVEFWFDYRRQ